MADSALGMRALTHVLTRQVVGEAVEGSGRTRRVTERAMSHQASQRARPRSASQPSAPAPPDAPLQVADSASLSLMTRQLAQHLFGDWSPVS